MKVLHARTVVGDAGNVGEGKERLPGKVVGRQHIVVHDGEADHGALHLALLQAHRELEALVKDGVEGFLAEEETKTEKR